MWQDIRSPTLGDETSNSTRLDKVYNLYLWRCPMDCRILLVDDENDICNIIKDMIARFCTKSRIDTCHSVRDALSKLESASYDLVISDLGVGKGYTGGIDVLRAAKDLGVFTALCSGSTVIPQDVQSYCDFILPKPFSMTNLKDMMDAYRKTQSFSKQVSAKYEVISAVTVNHVQDSIKKILDRFFKEFNLPMPKIKIVNQLSSDWLARCIYTPSLDKNNTTIKIQKRVTNDEKSLDRVLAHELIHHWDFLTQYGHLNPEGEKKWEEYSKRKRFGFKKDGHGDQFQDWANKINAVMGKDYVTKTSDMSYVTELDKDYYLLVFPGKSNPNQFSFAWTITPSSAQKADIASWLMEHKGKLFKSRDIRFMDRRFRLKDKKWTSGIPLEGYEQAALRELYHSGKEFHHNWTPINVELNRVI